jgi:hypothetical protein
MLTYDDCVGLCGLRPEEIDAIARHEHLPEIVALEMGACLAETPQGRRATRAGHSARLRRTRCTCIVQRQHTPQAAKDGEPGRLQRVEYRRR